MHLMLAIVMMISMFSSTSACRGSSNLQTRKADHPWWRFQVATSGREPWGPNSCSGERFWTYDCQWWWTPLVPLVLTSRDLGLGFGRVSWVFGPVAGASVSGMAWLVNSAPSYLRSNGIWPHWPPRTSTMRWTSPEPWQVWFSAAFWTMLFANQLVPGQSSSNHWTDPPRCQWKNPAHVSKFPRRGHIHQLIFVPSSAWMPCAPHLFPTQFLYVSVANHHQDHQQRVPQACRQIHSVPAVAKLFGAMLLVFPEGVFREGVSRMFCMVKLYSPSTSSKPGVLLCAEVESRRLTVFGLRLSWRIYDPNEVCVVPAAPWMYAFPSRMSRLLDQLKPARFQNHWNSSLSFPPLTLSQLRET